MLFAIKSEGVSRRSLSLVMCDCVCLQHEGEDTYTDYLSRLAEIMAG